MWKILLMIPVLIFLMSPPALAELTEQQKMLNEQWGNEEDPEYTPTPSPVPAKKLTGKNSEIDQSSKCSIRNSHSAGKGQAFSLSDALRCAQEDSGTEKFPQFMPGIKNQDINPTKEVPLIIQKLINGITLLAGGLAVLFIAVNGFRLTFGAVDSDQISQAKTGLIYGAVGLVVIIFSYIIAKTVIALTYIAG
jgi:uncharacterized membrane protein YidH (DUF202 family)